jgi:2,4-dienoyl-CoA reductase-like NADH-dependent reductase (Old Yellow Enzyme family)
MPELFEATTIDNIGVSNRFVRSATWEGMAREDGSSTERLNELMARLAEGEVGLIISSHAFVSREGQAGPWQLGVYGDHHLSGLTDMARKVHDAGGRIVLQLAHAGCKAAQSLSGLQPVGPSAEETEKGTCREMDKEDIAATVQAFADAAVRGQKAGFDGVQIHAAHGYLLSQFLSPYYNRRTDEYGGSAENRARIVLEVLREIKKRTQQRFPVLIKINSEDFLEGGFSVQDMLRTTEMLEQEGISAIELSGGTGDSGKLVPPRRTKIQSREDEVYYKQAALQCRQRLSVPLILVGGVRSFEVADELVREETADFVALSRPLIREPELIKRWKSGDRAPSGCDSDNLCFKPILNGEGMYCRTRYLEEQKGKT